jgi:hypothetical protein
MTSPQSFLKIANSKYDAITSFGHTHSTRTPEQWAAQILGLNFDTASASFLLRATSAIPAPSTIARASPKFRSPLSVQNVDILTATGLLSWSDSVRDTRGLLAIPVVMTVTV